MENHNVPIRVAVTGATGRMGQEIIKCLIQKKTHISENIALGAIISQSKFNCFDPDIKNLIEINDSEVIITHDINSVKKNFDVLIDFTSPQGTMEYLNFCTLNHKNMIIGTTGFSIDQKLLIENAAKKIGIVYSANFSIGIAIMFKLLKEISKILKFFENIDIIEIHHNKKKDIPSGTALTMRDIVIQNQSQNDLFSDIISVYSSNKINSNKKSCIPSSSLSFNNDSIKIHSIRSGDIVGTHTVFFSNSGERLEITHQSFNRIIFAYGALYSAIWLGKVRIGLFNLHDVLKFNI